MPNAVRGSFAAATTGGGGFGLEAVVGGIDGARPTNADALRHCESRAAAVR
jgi:hypothetical protein